MGANVWKDGKIKCPRCDIFMRKEEIEVMGPNFLIDFCVQCHSYWFDKGELNKYLRTDVVDKDLRKKDGYLGWGKPACPRCTGKISLKFIGDLEVDHCDDCGGLWLDHGELKALQEKDLNELKESRLRTIFKGLKEIAGSEE